MTHHFFFSKCMNFIRFSFIPPLNDVVYLHLIHCISATSSCRLIFYYCRVDFIIVPVHGWRDNIYRKLFTANLLNTLKIWFVQKDFNLIILQFEIQCLWRKKLWLEKKEKKIQKLSIYVEETNSVVCTTIISKFFLWNSWIFQCICTQY